MKEHWPHKEWQPLLLFSWQNRNGPARHLQAGAKSGWMKRLGPSAEFVLDLVVLLIYRLLGAAGAPLARMLTLGLWVGMSVQSIAMEVRRIIFSCLAWQNQKPRQSWLRFVRRWHPDVRHWHITVALVLLGTASFKLARYMWSFCSHAARRRRSVQAQLKRANTYCEWQSLASDLDAIQLEYGRNVRQRQLHDRSLYDVNLLREKLLELQRLRDSRDVEGLMFALRADLYRNFGNITNREIHAKRHMLPAPINEYITAVKNHLDYICDSRHSANVISTQAKLSFFQETRHAFGRTALVLSGGGSLGAFHLGLVRALLEQGVLPRIIAGSSVGSIVAAIAAVHTDAELKHMYTNMDNFNLSFFANSTTLQFVEHLFKKGTLQDITVLVKRLRCLLADCTFVEAYERTGRMLNVTVTAADTNEPPRMLNYLTAPNTVVWSAVAASSAFPGLFPAQELLAKDSQGRFVKFAAHFSEGTKRRWHDGSLENDLPFRQLSEMFNVNHFIVGQTNPHLVPLLALKDVFSGSFWHLMEAEIKHAMMQAQLYMPKWVPTKWMRLFTQPWEGDVTIVLPWRLYARTIAKAIQNPSQADLITADHLGKIATWQRMAAIQSNCAIEMKLDQCLLKAMTQAVAANQSAASLTSRQQVSDGSRAGAHTSAGSRIPSWLHLPALPAFTSCVNLDSSSASVSARAADGQPAGQHEGAQDGVGLPEALQTQPTSASTSSGEAGSSDFVRHHLRDDRGEALTGLTELSHVALDAVSLPLDRMAAATGAAQAQRWNNADCTDNSVRLWENLLPLAQEASAGGRRRKRLPPSTFSLDVIAP